MRGASPRNEPLTLTRCYSCELPQLYEALKGGSPFVAELTTLKGIKGKFSIFILLSFASLLMEYISWHDACQTRGGGRR